MGFYKCVLVILEYIMPKILAVDTPEETLELFQGLMKDELFVNSEFERFVQTKDGSTHNFKAVVENEFVWNFKSKVAEVGLSQDLLTEIEGLYAQMHPKKDKGAPKQGKN